VLIIASDDYHLAPEAKLSQIKEAQLNSPDEVIEIVDGNADLQLDSQRETSGHCFGRTSEDLVEINLITRRTQFLQSGSRHSPSKGM
jgi:hypothetical protein